MRHLAIDCGRNAVKVCGEGYLDTFPSVVGEPRMLRLKNAPRPTDIILNDKELGRWYVGDLAKDESRGAGIMMFADKVHRDTQLLVLAAAARYAKDGETLRVTTGVPIQFHTQQGKREMVRLLAGSYEVEINGVKKRFAIQDVKVATEGAAAYMLLCAGKGGTRRFIDIGSRTVNYGTVINGRYIDRESGTLDFGMGYGGYEAAPFVSRLVRELSRVWPTFNGEVHVLGGGAKVCSTGLAEVFPNLLCAMHPEFVNARAFYLIGEKAK